MAYPIEKNRNFLNLSGLILDARFEIEQYLTHGSYSEIHLARNLSPQPGEPDTVIVKALNLSFQKEEDAELERTLVENIALEAQTLADFHHDSIVRLYACGHALDVAGRSFYYLVLEYVRGVTLSQSCRNNPLTFDKALPFTAQICDALSYAHARDIVHRDIKPDNIMLTTPEKRVKILDFGVARHLSSYNGLMTQVGTELYAAPEHHSLSSVAGTKLTPAADVYGLAKTIYYMLTGRPPYEFRQKQITALPAPINTEPWAADVLRVLSKATHEDPALRYQSAEDFHLALQAINDAAQESNESTRVSARSYREAAANRKHPHIRIVVGVPTNQHNASGVAVKEWCRSFFARTRNLPSFISSSLRATYDRVSTSLRNCQLSLINLLRNVTSYLRTLSRKLLFRVALIIIITAVLLIALPSLIKHLHPTPSTTSANQTKTGTTAEKLMVASTDINLRSAPSRKAARVGLVERDSKVRILRFNSDRKWAEIEIIQHGRPKEDASSADRGWVYTGTLR
jgi:serine/threonine protein kinase